MIDWKLIPGSQKLSTRFFSVQITGENTGLFDIAPPKVHVELRARDKLFHAPSVPHTASKKPQAM